MTQEFHYGTHARAICDAQWRGRIWGTPHIAGVAPPAVFFPKWIAGQPQWDLDQIPAEIWVTPLPDPGDLLVAPFMVAPLPQQLYEWNPSRVFKAQPAAGVAPAAGVRRLLTLGVGA